MADEKRQEDEDDLLSRFPSIPNLPEVPEAPKATLKMPPRQEPTGTIAPGSLGKTAIATQAAAALTTPVLVLAIGGYLLDKKFGTNWIALVGVVVGFIVGVSSLLKILQKLDDK